MTTQLADDPPSLTWTTPDGLAEMSGLDRVLEVEPGRTARAIRNVPSTLPLLATHFPRFPVLPGVLILDDLAAVAALTLAAETGPVPGWRLAGAARIRYRHFVRPGDSAELTVVRKENAHTPDEGRRLFEGTVRVDGRKVTT
ncbi:3-hydroxyacyl-ACP dehydratase FabZ family protein, partial [Phytoactinopolyspora endophytica]|uniref:3-hydroxyacyl-ACP dehydratase FabZ family protein n=1 Tax=Phytoactinopolyspora endophytica TaxID=1642495 RepID=UPI00197BA0D8